MREAIIRIDGKVQGVFFREFALDEAERLGIVGTVSNQKDGSVRVVAQGYELKIKEYIQVLEEGTPLSTVAFVTVVWQKEPSRNFEDFSIVTENNDN